jgi:mono/diheme cytochrome c family protein
LTGKRLPAPRRLAAPLLLAVLAGCTDWAGYDLDRAMGAVPWLSTMRESVSYDPYELPRLPASGSVPVASPMGDLPETFTQAELETVAAALVNPLPPTPEVIARGELAYNRQCVVCHGPTGAGDGPVVGNGKFPFAPPVNGAATAGRSDGYIYGVIRVGRGLMPAYGERLNDPDRWAVVHYVRSLRGGASASPSAVSSQPLPPTTAPTVSPTVAPTVAPNPSAASAAEPR